MVQVRVLIYENTPSWRFFTQQNEEEKNSQHSQLLRFQKKSKEHFGLENKNPQNWTYKVTYKQSMYLIIVLYLSECTWVLSPSDYDSTIVYCRNLFDLFIQILY